MLCLSDVNICHSKKLFEIFLFHLEWNMDFFIPVNDIFYSETSFIHVKFCINYNKKVNTGNSKFILIKKDYNKGKLT